MSSCTSRATVTHTYKKWEYVFWINIVAQLLAFIIFITFGSAKIQDWNYPEGQPPTDSQEPTPKAAASRVPT